jgi:hypothetical protein
MSVLIAQPGVFPIPTADRRVCRLVMPVLFSFIKTRRGGGGGIILQYASFLDPDCQLVTARLFLGPTAVWRSHAFSIHARPCGLKAIRIGLPGSRLVPTGNATINCTSSGRLTFAPVNSTSQLGAASCTLDKDGDYICGGLQWRATNLTFMHRNARETIQGAFLVRTSSTQSMQLGSGDLQAPKIRRSARTMGAWHSDEGRPQHPWLLG